jgi:HEPN domain-containing protein
MGNRAEDWLRQAENDLLWTRDTLASGHYSQCCFVAQQTAEKAVTALALFRGADTVKSHSISELDRMGKRLDLYYISARYPDAFPSGAPFEYFDREQAEEAVEFASRVVDIVRGKVAHLA